MKEEKPFSGLLTRLGARLPVLLFIFFIVLPLLIYFAGLAMHPADALSRLFSTRPESSRLGGLLVRTFGIAALAATLAAAAGLAAVTAALWAPARAGRILLFAAAVPFFIPEVVAAIAWIQACGYAGWITRALAAAGLPEAWLPRALYSVPGCAAVLALHDYPIAAALAWIGWRGVGRASLESGATLMPPGRLWRAVAAGWLRPWLAAGWLLVFMRALQQHSVPLLLRQDVFSVEVVKAYTISCDPAGAGALALPMIIAGLAGAALLGRILARVRWPADPGLAPRLPRPRRCALFAFAVAGLFILPALAVTLGTLIKAAGGWGTYKTVLLSARDQIGFSLAVASAAVLGAVLLGAALAVRNAECAMRNAELRISNFRFQISNFLWGGMIVALLGLPGSVVGMAQIAFWNRPGWAGVPGAFYDRGLALPLTLAALALPVAWIVLRGKLRETPRVLIESQALRPAGAWRTWRWLIAPRLARPALLATGLVFVLSMHEAQASLLLAAPGQETMSIRALTLLHNAPDALVAGLCTIMTGLIACIFAIVIVIVIVIDAKHRPFAPNGIGQRG